MMEQSTNSTVSNQVPYPSEPIHLIMKMVTMISHGYLPLVLRFKNELKNINPPKLNLI
jgi:hypothetical protein